MTDEVLEAMARGMWEASGAPAHVPYGWHGLAETTRERWRDHIRAAIRALPAGWVVAKVPEARTKPDTYDVQRAYNEGQRDMAAAVRASAVELPHD